jgi:hypothetical protein
MVRTPPDSGRVEYRKYLLEAALGQALDNWGAIEGRMSTIFCAATNPSDPDVASAVYSSILSFEVQLAVTNAAVQQRFAKKQSVLDAWSPLRNQCDRQRRIRNELAHGKIVYVSGPKDPAGSVRYLAFFHYFTHKDRESFKHYSADDVDRIAAKFAQLSKGLTEFGTTIGARDKARVQNWTLK